jgi:hypothetical protein
MGNFAVRGLRTLGREISRLLSPEPLSAAVKTGTGVGGTTKNFSTFGVVDAALPINYGASDYRYRIDPTSSDTAGWTQVGFDDHTWSTGTAAFGSEGGCSVAENVQTAWPTATHDSTQIFLRKLFGVPAGSTQNLQIRVAIDNDVKVFVNGVDITATGGTPDGGGFLRHEGCAEPGNPFTFVASNLVPGAVNVITVIARDRGVESYVDLQASLFSP